MFPQTAQPRPTRTPPRDARAARRRARIRRGGFTLTEALVASVILAASSVGVMSMVSASYGQASTAREDAAAAALARELIEEVAAVPFAAVTTDAAGATIRADAAGWPANANRQQYDNVADFNGYADAIPGAAAATGIAVPPPPGGGTYARKVVVVSSPLAHVPDPAKFRAVQVTVTTPGGRSVTLSRLVAAGDPGRAGG